MSAVLRPCFNPGERTVNRRMSCLAALALAGASAALAAERPAPAAQVPPGWNTKWTGTLLCPRCTGLAYPENVGKCQDCGKGTASGAFRLCPTCARKAKKCSRCLSPFPGAPTAGMRLEISWLKPDLKIKDPHMNVDSAACVPIWVSVVNTTQKPVAATELQARGNNAHRCETLIFISRQQTRRGAREKVLFNVSPWIKRRRSLPLKPLTFPPGPTVFESDLAKCYSALGKLGPGRHTVTAAAGRLVSNPLTLQVGDGMIDAPPVASDPKTREMTAKLMAMWRVALKQGRYAEAHRYARRIARLDPAAGKKLLELMERRQATEKRRADEEAEKKALEEKIQREKMLRDEELKRRLEP